MSLILVIDSKRLRANTKIAGKGTPVSTGLVSGAASDLFTLTSLIHSSGTRGHTYKLYPRCNRVDLYKYFFSQRIIDVWNNLPAKSHDFSSLARFTRLVKSTHVSHLLSLGY